MSKGKVLDVLYHIILADEQEAYEILDKAKELYKKIKPMLDKADNGGT